MHICFLDIDGTLVLTGGAGETAFAQTLADDFGIAEIDGAVTFAGRSDRAIAMELFRIHGVETSIENWERFCVGYLSRLNATLASHRGRVLLGVSELLTALAARGDIALGLLTGNVREGARKKLEHYALWHWFSFGGYGDEYLERNDIAAAALTDARLFLGREKMGASQNGNASGEIVVIGDTPNDIACGRSIGARCVAVATGHTTPDELRQAKPDVLVESLAEIGPVLSLFATT